MEHRSQNSGRIELSNIDALGHIIRVPTLKEGEDGYNSQIDVFDSKNEGDRAQVYQMWAISQFAEHPIAMRALKRFNLAGDAEGKEAWTQLLEHIAGVTAIALAIDNLLEKYGAESIDTDELKDATLYDNLEKPYAIMLGRERLATAALVHDVEKPAELAAAKQIAIEEEAAGLENSLDNPIIRSGALWHWLHAQGVDESTIIAAQNTGRSDRLFSDYEDYPEDMIKKARMQRESLAELLKTSVDEVDMMTPGERREKSIDAKGLKSAIVGIADALAVQFKFQGVTDESIEATGNKYLTRKKDPESVIFFSKDWPEYYKKVVRYMINQVPKENRQAFQDELYSLTHESIFNQTVAPAVLGSNNKKAETALRY